MYNTVCVYIYIYLDFREHGPKQFETFRCSGDTTPPVHLAQEWVVGIWAILVTLGPRGQMRRCYPQ